jgi:16S rRNA (uracil1498-N3)-methyltransferase
MRRFFFNTDQRRDEQVTLGDDESHHISKVLRLRKGDLVELCDPIGQIFRAEIVSTGKNVQLILHEKIGDVQMTDAKLIIGQGAIKNKNMELVLQKCTELGVDSFYPYIAERSQGSVVQGYRGKGERWRRIISEACKQSLRSQPMELQEILPFAEMISLHGEEEGVLRLVLWEKEKQSDFSTCSLELKSSRKIILLLGPEGGFTEKEVEQAKLLGWQTIGMGERILRAETAVIAAVSIVQYLRGCM